MRDLASEIRSKVFQGERMTAPLLDRLTHRCHIFEMNGESYRFREVGQEPKEEVRIEPICATPRGGS